MKQLISVKSVILCILIFCAQTNYRAIFSMKLTFIKQHFYQRWLNLASAFSRTICPCEIVLVTASRRSWHNWRLIAVTVLPTRGHCFRRSFCRTCCRKWRETWNWDRRYGSKCRQRRVICKCDTLNMFLFFVCMFGMLVVFAFPFPPTLPPLGTISLM